MTYINCNSTDPFFNFALEEYFLTQKDTLDNCLFWFWRTTPTVMVGRFQNTSEEINAVYVREHGINVVRRNSGGGAIYTDEGAWQFSFIIKNYNENNSSFKYFTQPVIKVLQDMGVPAAFGSRNDITVNGKKISGNAQYKKQTAMVHHGSILYKTDLEALTDSLKVSQDKIFSKSIKSVRERVANISEFMENPLTVQEFKERMVRGILGTSGTEYELTSDDAAHIEQGAAAKFRTWEWNYGCSPAFDIERKKRYAAGGFQIRLQIANGIIVSCSICGDFFETGNIPVSTVEKSLCGIPYRKADIERTVHNKKLHTAFYLLDERDLVESIID
ncbi:lipoate--protein ligase [Treponema lecithinolyticum]|uniref:lipoate--protein ligase n=1 Tax=Treponema lecithinolyticum ATCC 700332 TaxID=1321815 RepID=A0ABN0NZT6_TRELE|nr:lipoate--protein ligase [Treponema lecithinolyticum]ERJ93623.1 lipoyltransferase and lipoate-protein ligase [Treponema lecithinolyticum ATCC 700332]